MLVHHQHWRENEGKRKNLQSQVDLKKIKIKIEKCSMNIER